MRIIAVSLHRNAKVSLGNYENTDISMELTASVDENESLNAVVEDLTAKIKDYLRSSIDEIELGRSKAKANRFGV